MDPKPKPGALLIALLILVFFMVDRALASGFLLPLFCNEDERWVHDGAVKMVHDASIDPGAHKYPELMTALTASVYGAGYLAANLKALPHFESRQSFAWHRSHFHFDFVSSMIWGRMLAAALGALALLVLYRLARKESGEETALLSLLLMATAPAFLFSTMLLKPDALLVIGVLLAVGSSLKVLDRGLPRDYVLAGAAIGFCLAAKYHVPAFVPALIAHRLRRRDLSLVRAFRDPRWLLILPAALVAFAILSPITWLDLQGAIAQAKIEFIIQHFDPLLLRSSEHWWQVPVLFQFTSALPLALGIPMYLLSLIGLARRVNFRDPRRLVIWSYPLGLIAFMILTSGLGAPQLYVTITPFFALAAAQAMGALLAKPSRLQRAAAVTLVAGIAAYNLVLFHSFIGLEDRIIREPMQMMESSARPGLRDLAFVPYYPNPDRAWTIQFAPQFLLSEKLIEQDRPGRILVHHAFYNAFLDNPELMREENVARMIVAYLELRAEKAGFRETDRFTGLSFNAEIYAALLPDLAGLFSSIYERTGEQPPAGETGGH